MEDTFSPIFIIGLARNGTTWLGNLLVEHFNIATPRHFLHYGVKESNIYANYKYWGDLSKLDNYITFLNLYTQGDYFKLASGEKDQYVQDRHSYKNFHHFYLHLMDRYKAQTDAETWCTKICPQYFLDKQALTEFSALLNSRYKSPKFILIKRKFDDYLNSYLNMSGSSFETRNSKKGRRLAEILGTIRYASFYEGAEEFCKKNGGVVIKYEDLKNDVGEILNNISAYLKLSKVNKLEQEKYYSNSSFKNPKQQSQAKINFTKKLPIQFLLNNTSLSTYLLKQYEKSKKMNNPEYYRLMKYKYFKEELIEELKNMGDTTLVEALREDNE